MKTILLTVFFILVLVNLIYSWLTYNKSVEKLKSQKMDKELATQKKGKLLMIYYIKVTIGFALFILYVLMSSPHW